MKKQNILKELIDKMFSIAGYDIGYSDIVNRQDEWYSIYTMTEEENEEWIKWGVDYIRNTTWIKSKKLAKKEMEWMNLMYGLKIK